MNNTAVDKAKIVRDSPIKTGERTPFFNSIYADILGGILTLSAGIGTAFLVINKSFFGNLDTDKQKLKSVDARDKARDAALKGPNWRNEIQVAEKEYKRAAKIELEERGIKNIFDKWGTLRSHQKWEAGLAIAAVSAVTIGAISAYFGSRDTNNKLNAIQQRLDQQDNFPQR